MNKEEKNLLKITFTYEYYKDNITERYMRDLSRNVILDNDCLDIEYLEKIYVIPYKKYNQLKKQLEENKNPLKGIFAQVNDDTLLRDCGNMNAEIKELKNQQKEFIDYLENEKDRLARECSRIYVDSLGKTRLVNEDIFNEVDKILSKYYEIIGYVNE